uniref:Orange domain-containing protein n=1 Tax=Anolis carolinensis TaxID=28377 RepID=A0A803SMC4_ANOCA
MVLFLTQHRTGKTLKKPKVEKAEILEIAVGYLREMASVFWPTTPRNPIQFTNRTLQTCFRVGFRECLLGLAAFLQQAHPSVQSHLLDTLHLYLASKPEAHPQDWNHYYAFSPSPSFSSSSSSGSPPRTPEAFSSSPQKIWNEPEPLRPNPDPPCGSAGQHGDQPREAQGNADTTNKRIPLPPPAFWRPWP